MSSISLNSIRKSLSDKWDGEISRDACEYIRNQLVNALIDISERSSMEMQDINNIRKEVDLPEHKRITVPIVKMLEVKVYKRSPEFGPGEVGRNNKDTTLSEATEEVI